MSAALLLLGFAVAISVAAPAALSRAGWVTRDPRLGIAAWCASVLSVTLAFVGAGLALAVVPVSAWRAVCGLWRVCMIALAGGHGAVGRLAAIAGLAVAAAVLLRLAYTVARTVPAAITWRHEHLAAVRAVGRAGPAPDIMVLDCPQPAGYVIAGWSRAVVVVTSGAVQRLTGAELAALVAHERGHAAGRHHVLLSGLRLLSQAFPGSRLLGQALTQVSQLAEVCADDAAVKRHSRRDLARAMIVVAEGTSASRLAPATALAASGGDAAARIRRLLSPPTPPPRWTRCSVTAAVLLLPVVPLAVVALARWWPVLAGCPQLFG
ncbi:MAG: M56 family metallopeptidase [Micromonosporaceae bacterium]